MRIEIATLPKAVQEWVATLPFDDDIHLAKSTNELTIDEPLFDIDQMKKAIAGCETEELALKNGLMLPQGKNKAELLAWLRVNIPKHLNGKEL